jgi:hypothetical protein
VPNSRLAGRVREDRRIGQRRERALDGLWPSMGNRPEQRDQDTSGIEKAVTLEVVRFHR